MSDAVEHDASCPSVLPRPRRSKSRETIGEEQFNDLRHLLQATFPLSAKSLETNDALVESVADLLVGDENADGDEPTDDDDRDGSFADANVFGIEKHRVPPPPLRRKRSDVRERFDIDKVRSFVGGVLTFFENSTSGALA
jgi:hypothetical protein